MNNDSKSQRVISSTQHNEEIFSSQCSTNENEEFGEESDSEVRYYQNDEDVCELYVTSIK